MSDPLRIYYKGLYGERTSCVWHVIVRYPIGGAGIYEIRDLPEDLLVKVLRLKFDPITLEISSNRAEYEMVEAAIGRKPDDMNHWFKEEKQAALKEYVQEMTEFIKKFPNA